jgi:hypothetical protein
MVGSAPRPKKPSVKNPEMGAYPGCSAFSCKSLQPQISRISAEIPPTFQRAFLNRECAGSNPPRSARHSCVRPGLPRDARMGRNPGFSRIRFSLWTPGLPRLRRKSAKISGLLRNYSRFGEIMSGDRFDHDCRPTEAVRFRTDKLTKAEPERRWRSRPQVHAYHGPENLSVSGDLYLRARPSRPGQRI